MHTVHPAAEEPFHLRILFHHVPGADNFSALRGVRALEFSTFQEACLARGLLQNDAEWDLASPEATCTQSCSSVREIYVTVLLFCNPADPAGLFEKHTVFMVDDFTREYGGSDKALIQTILLMAWSAGCDSRERSFITLLFQMSQKVSAHRFIDCILQNSQVIPLASMRRSITVKPSTQRLHLIH